MITRILYNEEKATYDKAVRHPVQTWAWGDFQISQGHRIYRLGIFDQKKNGLGLLSLLPHYSQNPAKNRYHSSRS